MKNLLSKILFKFSEKSYKLPEPKKTQINQLNIIQEKVKNIHHGIEHSLKQYEAHKLVYPSHFINALNIASIIMLPIVILLLVARQTLVKKSEESNISFFSNLPDEVVKSFSPTILKKTPIGVLNLQILKLVFLNTPRPLSNTYFLLRLIWKGSIYNEVFIKYKPNKIFNSQEMNFESSFLTYLCEQRDCEHINIMHGEKIFNIKDSFSRFHIHYIWDEYYASLFKKLKSSSLKYKVYNPIPKVEPFNTSKKVLKYYAQISTNFDEFKKRIQNLLSYAQNNDLELILRFHPKHIRLEELQYVQNKKIKIETAEIEIFHSIETSEWVCAESSTVLFQAFKMNKNIIIDNTNNDNISKLKDLDLFILNVTEPIYLTKS